MRNFRSDPYLLRFQETDASAVLLKSFNLYRLQDLTERDARGSNDTSHVDKLDSFCWRKIHVHIQLVIVDYNWRIICRVTNDSVTV